MLDQTVTLSYWWLRLYLPLLSFLYVVLPGPDKAQLGNSAVGHWRLHFVYKVRGKSTLRISSSLWAFVISSGYVYIHLKSGGNGGFPSRGEQYLCLGASADQLNRVPVDASLTV